MPRRVIIEAAFVISHAGNLVDAGILERSKGQILLHRLSPTNLSRTGKGEVPEQLGLLFVLYYLTGQEGRPTQASPQEHFVIAPDELQSEGPKSSNFPGLVSYIRNHFRKANKKRERIGEDYVFDGNVFRHLFRLKRRADTSHGIATTGIIGPNDVLLLEAVPNRLVEIYKLLREFDIAALGRMQMDPQEARKLRDSFRTRIGLARVAGDSGVFMSSGQQTKRAALPEGMLSIERVREAIEDILVSSLRINDVLVPDGWAGEKEEIRSSMHDQIFSALPGVDWRRQEGRSIGQVLLEILSTLSGRDPKAAIAMMLLSHYLGDYNMATAYGSASCQRWPDDGIGWVLLGRSLLTLGREKAARDSFGKAIRSGQRVAGFLGMALSFRRPSDRKEAWKYIKMADGLRPHSVPVLTVKAKWLSRYGNAEEALGIANRILDDNPGFVPAADVRVVSLYAMNRHDEVVQLAKALLVGGHGILYWPHYCLVASLYGLGDYPEAKREARAILEASNNTELKGYLHIVLRKIAVVEKDTRAAVRHSAAVCYLASERETRWIWLASDLEWAGHLGLAEQFWSKPMDPTAMDDYQRREALLLFTLHKRWDEAVKYACLLDEADIPKVCLDQIPHDQLHELGLRLQLEFASRLANNTASDWREPLCAIRALSEGWPDCEVLLTLRWNTMASLARAVGGEVEVGEWLDEVDEIARGQCPAFIRCIFAYRAHHEWKAGPKSPRALEAISRVCSESVSEALNADALDAKDLHALSVALGVLAEIAEGVIVEQSVDEFAHRIKAMTPERIQMVCEFGLEYLVGQLLVNGHLTTAASLSAITLSLLEHSFEPFTVGSLAQASALGCLACSVLDSSAYDCIGLVDSLEKRILLLLSKGVGASVFLASWINMSLARASWLCRTDVGKEAELPAIAEKVIVWVRRCDDVDQEVSDRSLCTFLGSLAVIATNNFLDDSALQVLGLAEQLFGTSDRHASMLAFFKRKVMHTRQHRPLAIGRLFPALEETEPDLYRMVVERASMSALWNSMSEDAKGKLKGVLNDIERKSNRGRQQGD